VTRDEALRLLAPMYASALPEQIGWQDIKLSTPVPIKAHQTYIVSSFTETGSYVRTLNYFATPHIVGPLTASGGAYKYSTTGTYPTNAFNANYWVDVVFLPKLPA
jgi:Domain of unknown function (DUF4082)